MKCKAAEISTSQPCLRNPVNRLERRCPIVTSLSQIASAESASTMNANPAGTARLTSALARGDDEAFRSFHEQYGGRLMRYLFVVCRGDETQARDALQETFVRVARHVRTIDSETVFWSWLTVVARSAAADQARRRSSYGRMLARVREWFAALPDNSPIESGGEADWTLESLLNQAMADLPLEDRALVQAKYLNGASIKELAMQCNSTERAVESRLGRLRQRLREDVARRLEQES
jgi:RNA polymerase sigma-70 factor (ECF subfamily)